MDCTQQNQTKWKTRFPEKFKESVKRAKAKRSLRDPTWRMDSWRWLQYGLSKEQFATMRADQKEQCKICNTVMKLPYVDHDHQTGKIRGLLCFRCNTALGNFSDSILVLESAISYLRATNTKQQNEEK